MNKIGVNVIQGNALTQTVFGGLNIYPAVANFLLHIQCGPKKVSQIIFAITLSTVIQFS